MAASGSASVTVTSWDTLKFSWAVSGQSVANNTSTVTWKLELISGSDGRIDSNASKSWSVTVNGNTFKGTNKIAVANNSTVTLAEGTVANGKAVTISHNSDGSKTFSYSFSQQFDITFGGSHIGTKSGTGSGTLNVIARRSSISASNGTLGTSMKLTISKQDSDFTHTITYKCGTAEGTIVTKTTSTSVSWTPPLSLANQNTTGTSVTVTFTITTYTGSTSLGNNSKTISCAIPASVKPTVSVAVTDAAGHKDTFGSYIQGKSKLKASITASGSYGSTIKQYKTTADGKSYTTASFTSGAISSSGTVTINVTVTDSRGRTATTSTTVSVLPYAAPKITSLTVMRCDASGNSSTSGAYLGITFSSSITALNGKNTAQYVLQYKKTSASDYTTATLTAHSGQHTVNGGVFVFPAEVASSYNIVLTASDTFSSTGKTATGSSVKKVFSIFRNGLGFAFNKIAELEGVLDIGFKTKFSGGIMNEVLSKISDLNDVLIPNTYVSVNKGAASYTNCPIASGTFTLEVMSAGAEGQVFQRLTTAFKNGKQECWERHFFTGSWGSWSCVYSDTGWIDIPLQSGFSYGSEYSYLKGRLKNDVLYIRGDVKGISGNYQCFAILPATLMPTGLGANNRTAGVYNVTAFCGFNLQNTGRLYVSENGTGAWDKTKDVSVNITLCGN